MIPLIALRRLAALVLACAAAGPAPVAAAAVPWGTRPIDRVYEHKDLRELLRELAASQGIVANIDPEVPATPVHGRFTMPAGALFQYLESLHGLIHYYAGNVLYIYPASAAVTDVIQLRRTDPAKVMRTLGELKLTDPQYPITVNRADGSLVVSGPRIYVDMVRRVARAGERNDEAAPAEVQVRVFALKYAWADDQVFRQGGREITVPGVASVLRKLYQGAGNPSAAQVRSDTTLVGANLALGQEPVTRRLRNSDLELRLPPRMSLLAPDAERGDRGDGEPPLRGPDRAPAAGEGALPQITVDSRVNAVIVRDIVARMASHEQVVRALDVRPMLVEIEASVIEIASSDLSELGVDWRFASGRFDVRSGRADLPPTGIAGPVPPANGSFTPGPQGGVATSLGGVLTTILTDGGRQLIARVNALARNGKASFRAAPKVLTVENSEAVLERLRSFFVKVPGTYQSQLFDVSVGTSMRVTPMVVHEAPGPQVKMAVKIEDGELTGQFVEQIPIITRNTIGTQAFVGAGESLLIAGYTEDSTQHSEAGVPGLANVPLLGWLFKQREQTGARVERLFMITPRLVEPRAAAAAATPAGASASAALSDAPAP